MTFNEKKIYKEMNTDNFYTRIREEQSKNGKVYYLGIEPFTIGKESLITNISKSMFKFNSFNINEENKNKLRELREYFFGKNGFKLKYIELQKGNKSLNDKETMVEAITRISQITKVDCKPDNEKYIFNILNPISIDDEYKVFKLIYIDYKDFFKKCDFKYSDTTLVNEIRYASTISKELKDKLILLITNYENYTHVEPEKKYQHLFLKNVKELKVDSKSKNIIPFEEEYYIYDKTDSGRIDCVFYTLENNEISEIILIELKVDTGVIGGAHGIHRHLIDIKKMSENAGNFYNTLKERINYRENQLGSDDKYQFKDDFKTSFYIFLARTNDKVNLESAVKDLNNPKSRIYKKMKKEINEEFKNNLEKGKTNIFTKEEIIKPIKGIYNSIDKNKVDVKLFIDQNIWDKNKDILKPNYVEKTEWLND